MTTELRRAGLGLLCLALACPATAARAALELELGNTTAVIGGFVKLNVLQSDVAIDNNRRGAQWLHLPDIPVASPGSGGKRSSIHAKESRLWFRTTMLLGQRELNTLVEYDLFDSGSDYTPRLRHAYATFGKLLAGQTFTTFTNSVALADLDTGIAIGNIPTRQHLLRWTQPLPASGHNLMVAVEESSTRLIPAAATNLLPADQRYQDYVLRYNYQPAWGDISLAALTRKVEPGHAGTKPDVSRRSTAFSLSGRINSGSLDNLRFTVSAGSALARHIAVGSFFDGTYSESALHEDPGTLQGHRLQSALVAWQHFWAPRWRSTLALGYARAALAANASEQLTQEGRSAQLNLIWAPRPQTSLGIEYLYSLRELKQAGTGELNRLQLSLRLNF